MELNLQEQVIKIINDASNILLVTHVKPDGDALSSILAMFLLLEKIGKHNVYAACADKVPDSFSFLPSNQKIKQKNLFPKDFIISLDCSEVSVEKLYWNSDGKKLDIIISPKNGNFNTNQVSFSEKQENFDLIITLDASDKEQLGKLFFLNTQLFTETPIINIDHHISNTNFGTINLIDVTASSTTEVLYSLLPYFEAKSDQPLLDENIATLLLTGIITDTGSFQNPNTTPKSFEVAADLIEKGARQQEIIRKLFKTKSLSTLKLWGKVLSKIKNDPVHRFVWSTVSLEDLHKTSANSDDLQGVLDDLLSNAPGAEIVLLIKEREDGIISGSLRTTSNAIDATLIAKLFGGGGHRQAAGFKIPKNNRMFATISEEIINKIKNYQKERLGIDRQDHNNSQPIKKIETYEKKLPTKEQILDFSSTKKAIPPKNSTIDINSKINNHQQPQQKTNKQEIFINQNKNEKSNNIIKEKTPKIDNEKSKTIITKPQNNQHQSTPNNKTASSENNSQTDKKANNAIKNDQNDKNHQENQIKNAQEIFETAKKKLSAEIKPEELTERLNQINKNKNTNHYENKPYKTHKRRKKKKTPKNITPEK